MVAIKSIDEAKEIYQKLLHETNFESLSNEEIIDNLGIIIDLSFDFQQIEGLNYSISLGQNFLQTREFTSIQSSCLNYYLANAHSNLRNLENRTDQLAQRKELELEIGHLRRALVFNGKNELPDLISCQMFTNLGNAFSTCGRKIEALYYYDRALAINPKFPMARGNKGLCLFYSASMLYDPGHIQYFLKAAYKELQISLTYKNENWYAREIFEKTLESIKQNFEDDFLETALSFKEYSLGSSKGEKKYREWVLNNHLFLNPLNDLGPYSIAANDILHVPSIVAKIEDPPVYQGFYNQLKEEFISARTFCFEGINGPEKHFSDKDILLYDTLDYPEYSFKSEKLKIAYRVLYSIFDKIAYFLNDYFNLKIPEKKVYFKSIWFSPTDKTQFHENFSYPTNPGIQALFWLSRDLFDENPEFSGNMEPEAKELYIIRNHLEHKYFKLHLSMWPGKPSSEDIYSGIFFDTLAFSMYQSDFEKKTLKLLKSVRSGLMYLSFSIKFEEMRREKERIPSIKAPGILWKYEK